MKKVLAIVLSIMMIFAALPFAASAAVAKEDTAMDYLLDGEYSHLAYLAEKNNFKTELGVYTAAGLYEGAWDNLFTGSVDVSEAETILLALIEKVDAEYENETFEKIIKVLEGAKTVAGVVEKVDSVTGILDLAENAEWASAISGLGTIIKAANYANEMYEYAVEAYAAILSAQASSEFFGEYLDYIAANCTNKNVVKAAKNVKANISKTYEEAIETLLADIAEKIAKDTAGMGVEIAMDSWTVTAAIKTGYNTVAGLTKKVFGTTDKYKYMSSLVIVKDIEAVTPDYVKAVLADGSDLAQAFAVNAILTIRETGESMLNNLGKVVDETLSGRVAKLFTGVDKTEVKNNSAKGVATLAVIREIIGSEDLVETYAPTAVISTATDVVVYNAANEVIASLAANKVAKTIDANGAFVTVYNSVIDGTVTVIVPFVAGTTVEATEATAPAEGNSKPAEKMNFFQRLIQAIKDAFAKLFGKK